MAAQKKSKAQSRQSYEGIRSIDGDHPLAQVLGASVLYQVYRRPQAKVAYFNYDLAQEMGLIAEGHPHVLNDGLSEAILDTFALGVVNEYDITHNKKFENVKDKPRMATRYLQLQHQSRSGMTSGDGRSIWNGMWSNGKQSWDISSCGTGATCLSPAAAKLGRFIKTGDPSVSYGCGLADLKDGITNAVFSEVVHANGIPTERTLAVIEFPRNTAVVVRVAPNLFRPSHFFVHLRQRNLPRLRAVVDLFIQRQIQNGQGKGAPRMAIARYQWFLKNYTETFADMVARFEQEYIFCWLDWDGDNILADGKIIDYGSIRRLGVFHHLYRFDDVEQWSTNIKEQKEKALHMLKTTIQMVDYLSTGRVRPLEHFARHKMIRYFEDCYKKASLSYLLRRCGFDSAQQKLLLSKHLRTVKSFYKAFRHLEMQTYGKRMRRVQDGQTKPLRFNMRDFLYHWAGFVSTQKTAMSPQDFLSCARTAKAKQAGQGIGDRSRMYLKGLQVDYFKLLKALGIDPTSKSCHRSQWQSFESRLRNANSPVRVTGDGMIFVGDELMKARKKLSPEDFWKLCQGFIRSQNLYPPTSITTKKPWTALPQNIQPWLDEMEEIVLEYRESL